MPSFVFTIVIWYVDSLENDFKTIERKYPKKKKKNETCKFGY